jgi:hypothetical protein
MIREEGAELACMLKEAIGIPESEAKGVVNYFSFVSTVVRGACRFGGIIIVDVVGG